MWVDYRVREAEVERERSADNPVTEDLMNKANGCMMMRRRRRRISSDLGLFVDEECSWAEEVGADAAVVE